MYLYEELDLNALLDDPEIDPDSPEALYAAAQCHRLGKGTPVSEALYEDTLCLAAKAGSEAAQKELTARETQQAQPIRQEQAAPRAMFEIFRLADAGDPAAILEMAQYSREHGSAKDECDYLQRAAGQVAQGAYSAQQGQEIYIRLGELYAQQPLEEPEESCRCYGMASELGSVAAMLTLADYSARGYGCEESAEQARAWKLRAAERGTPEMKYEVALELGTEDHLRARAMLDEVAHTAPDEALRARARVWLELWENGGTLEAANIETAWTMRENALIAQQLTELYEEISKDDATKNADAFSLMEDNGNAEVLYYRIDGENAWIGPLRLTAERAEWLRKRPLKFSRRHQWAGVARELGSPEAAEYRSRYEASRLLCKQAAQAYREQNYEQAAALFREAAGQGNIDAAEQLADMYHTGRGVPQSDAEAGCWWNLAVKLGSSTATYHYALSGLPSSQEEKQRMMRKAAEWDEPNALGWLMKNASEQTTKEWAQERLIVFAMNGNVLAQTVLASLGTHYSGGINWMERAVAPRRGFLKGLKETNLWNYLSFKAILAEKYLNREKTPADAFAFAKETYEEFLECRTRLSKPLDQGISATMGTYYKKGIGTLADPARAVELYRSADKQYESCAPAWYALAECYLDGIGAEADLDQAEAAMKAYCEITGNRGTDLERKIQDIRDQQLAQRRLASKQEQEARERKRAENDKKRIRFLMIAGCVVLVTAVVLLRIWREKTFYRPTYLEAVSLMEQGAYDEARSAFDSISGYKDSAEKVEQCNDLQYGEAVALMGQGAYDDAKAMFAGICDYKDSAEKIEQCTDLQYGPQYDEASVLMASGDYEDAIEIFEALKAIDYRDTSREIAQCGRGIFAGTWLGESGGKFILYKNLECHYETSEGAIYVGTWDIINNLLTIQTNALDWYSSTELYGDLDSGYLSTSVLVQSRSSDWWDGHWDEEIFTKEASEEIRQEEENPQKGLVGIWLNEYGDKFVLGENMTCIYLDHNDFTFSGAGQWNAEDGQLFARPRTQIDFSYIIPWSHTLRGNLDNGYFTTSIVMEQGFVTRTYTRDTSGEESEEERALKALFAGTWQGDAGTRFILSENLICSLVEDNKDVYLGMWKVAGGQLVLDFNGWKENFIDLDNGYFTTSLQWGDETFTKSSP